MIYSSPNSKTKYVNSDTKVNINEICYHTKFYKPRHKDLWNATKFKQNTGLHDLMYSHHYYEETNLHLKCKYSFFKMYSLGRKEISKSSECPLA
jgi:hypothetical protein